MQISLIATKPNTIPNGQPAVHLVKPLTQSLYLSSLFTNIPPYPHQISFILGRNSQQYFSFAWKHTQQKVVVLAHLLFSLFLLLLSQIKITLIYIYHSAFQTHPNGAAGQVTGARANFLQD